MDELRDRYRTTSDIGSMLHKLGNQQRFRLAQIDRYEGELVVLQGEQEEGPFDRVRAGKIGWRVGKLIALREEITVLQAQIGQLLELRAEYEIQGRVR